MLGASPDPDRAALPGRAGMVHQLPAIDKRRQARARSAPGASAAGGRPNRGAGGESALQGVLAKLGGGSDKRVGRADRRDARAPDSLDAGALAARHAGVAVAGQLHVLNSRTGREAAEVQQLVPGPDPVRVKLPAQAWFTSLPALIAKNGAGARQRCRRAPVVRIVVPVEKSALQAAFANAGGGAGQRTRCAAAEAKQLAPGPDPDRAARPCRRKHGRPAAGSDRRRRQAVSQVVVPLTYAPGKRFWSARAPVLPSVSAARITAVPGRLIRPMPGSRAARHAGTVAVSQHLELDSSTRCATTMGGAGHARILRDRRGACSAS